MSEWADIAVDNGRLLTETRLKLASAERDRDGWELIAADQAALVKQVLADLTTACDDIDAVERRAAAAERENEELRATLGAAAQAGVELGQKLAEVTQERDTALESLDKAYGWLTTACAARDAATARERAAREALERIAAKASQEVRVGMAADTRTAPPYAPAVLAEIAFVARAALKGED